MVILKFFATTFLALLICGFVQKTNASDKLTVAVASNFLLPLKKLSKTLKRQEDIQIKIVTASSSKLYAQIQNGAPFDVFLSADRVTVEKLVEQNLIKPEDSFLYAKGQLVLWSAGHSEPESRLKKNQFKQLAIANPKLAPYGRAASEVLKKLGLMHRYEKKIIFAENVGQAFQYAYHQNVEAALIAFSQLSMKNLQNNYWLVPAELYSPIEQYGGVLAGSRNSKIAKKFVEFITSASVKQQIVNEFSYAPF